MLEIPTCLSVILLYLRNSSYDLGGRHLPDCVVSIEPVVELEVRKPFQRVVRNRPDNKPYLAE